MILDLDRFVAREQPHWRELEALLERCQPGARPLALEDWDRLRQLYSRAGWALTRLQQGANAPALERYLTTLVARSYGELYPAAALPDPRLLPARLWGGIRRFLRRFPAVFRAHLRFFALSLAITIAGVLVGGIAVTADPVAVGVLLPAPYLAHPGQRVHHDLTHPSPLLTPEYESTFAAFLMTHNIQVAIFALFLGVTFGLGTAVLLFENGVLLGAVVARYSLRGFGIFAAAWLLPHGVIEIPAILVGGQGGFLLASTMLKRGRESRSERLQRILPDLMVLCGGLSCMLVWAGTIEGFYSQHHGPRLYPVQIAFGLAELIALTAYLSLAGRRDAEARR